MNKLFVFSGQSGVGKNTILEMLLSKHPDFNKAVTCTTRDPRPSETEGVDHFFISAGDFKKKIQNDEFIEYAKVHNDLYGTPKSSVINLLNEDKTVLMEIDVQGAVQIKDKLPNAILIFIKYEPGKLEKQIQKRIENDRERGDTPDEEIAKRFESAKKEISFEKYYDFSIINPERHPEKAVEEIEEIIKENL